MTSYIHRLKSALSGARGWFNTGPCCNAMTPPKYVSGTTVNVNTTRNFMHKMWTFTNLKQYFQYKYMRQLVTVRSSQKWFPLSNLPSYISFKIVVFSHCFQWLLLAATTVEILNTSSSRNAWRTGLETYILWSGAAQKIIHSRETQLNTASICVVLVCQAYLLTLH